MPDRLVPDGHSRAIAIAADVSSLGDLDVLVSAAADCPDVCALKVGFSLVLRHGLPAVVSAVKRNSTLPVIYDHQKAGTDIPQMGGPFADACREAGADAVIIFPQSGPRTLEAFVSAAFKCELVPIVGIMMTHPGYLAEDGGFLIDNAPISICEKALALGVTEFVLPGTKPDVVRQFAAGALRSIRATIWMPGIGSQGGALRPALDSAAPHIAVGIIGSAIYDSPDPRAALHAFAREITA